MAINQYYICVEQLNYGEIIAYDQIGNQNHPSGMTKLWMNTTAGIERMFKKYSNSRRPKVYIKLTENTNSKTKYRCSLYTAGQRFSRTVPTLTALQDKKQKLYNSKNAGAGNPIEEEPKKKQPVKPITLTPTMQAIHAAPDLRPKELVLSDVKWKYLVRSVIRGKNLMITGPAGCGKTFAVTSVAKAMNRPFFYLNLGATQDPRSTLIGNTHFNKETGTYFADSIFVKAIQTEGSVILLDELSRAHPEAWNILMTVLDDTQRYLRIDESPDTPVVHVANGVSFIATANIGMEYTSTRVIDRAMQDRFQILEMDILTAKQQEHLIKIVCPEMDGDMVTTLANIYQSIQQEASTDKGKIQSAVSTRTILAAAQLVADGFTLQEAAEVCIYPYFDNDGGLESERTYVKQLVQKFIPDVKSKSGKMFSSGDTARRP